MFPERMLQLMMEQKITKKQICTDLGIGINQIKYWEKNNNYPDADVMKRIPNYLGTSISYLLETVENPDPLTFIFPTEQNKESPIMKMLGEKMRDMSAAELDEVNRYIDYLISRKK